MQLVSYARQAACRRTRWLTSPLGRVALALALLLCLSTTLSRADLRVLHPPVLQGSVRRSSWMPFGSERMLGQAVRGALVWVPHDAFCTTVDDAMELDADATLPRPLTHFGEVAYSEVTGTVVLFNTSAACPLLNQLFYVEAVLGATGAVALSLANDQLFPPNYNTLLTAPNTHMPSVAVGREDYDQLRSTIVERKTKVEVMLGSSVSEMFYD